LNKENEKQVIIRMDGGISSQIAFCALGKHFEDLGYKVKYDISWFKEYGEKLNGVNVRNYIIDKVFPALNFEIATQEEVSYYKKHFNIHQNIQDLQDKMYIDGYPAQRESLFIKYLEYFKANFKPLGIENITHLIKEIEENNSCAVHVRRGDLAKENIYYGKLADVDYFLKAINLIQCFNKNIKFFFFSEEPQWIKENIIPNLNDCEYKIIEDNDSTKGYLDLYLISKCKHVIASNGSFGTFGKALSQPETTLVLPNPNELYCRNFENIYIINKPDTIGKALESNNYLNEYKKFKKRYKRSRKIITALITLSILLFCIAIFLGVK